jgi:hypothetical protein
MGDTIEETENAETSLTLKSKMKGWRNGSRGRVPA